MPKCSLPGPGLGEYTRHTSRLSNGREEVNDLPVPSPARLYLDALGRGFSLESAYSFHLLDNKKPGKESTLPVQPASAGIDFRRVALPYCDRCQSDEFTHLESFKPALLQSNGTLRTLGQVTYFCSGCGRQLGHSVPPMWVPAGWYLG